LAHSAEKPIFFTQAAVSDMEIQKRLSDETRVGPEKQEPCRFYIVPAMEFPIMTMELLPSKLVSIDGGVPHGEWSRGTDKITSSGTMSRTQKKRRCAHMTMW